MSPLLRETETLMKSKASPDALRSHASRLKINEIVT